MPRKFLCFLALLRGLHGLRRSGRREPPDFFACHGEEGVEIKGCRPMDDLLATGYRRMRAVAATGRRPLAVHVGVDTLGNSAPWTDVHLYTRVFSRAGLPPGLLRLALVEPVEAKSESIWSHAKKLPALKGQVSLFTAMIDGSCPAASKPLYVLSPRAGHDFGFDTSMTWAWASNNRYHPLAVVKSRAAMNMPIACPDHMGDCRQNFRNFANNPAREAYVDELQVPCWTLEGLVHEAGARVRDLAMVVVDAEGLDPRILLPLAAQEEFKPGFIMWEEGGEAVEQSAELTHLLRRRGYEVGVKTGPMDNATSAQKLNTDCNNYIAVLKQPRWGSAMPWPWQARS